MSSRNSKKKRLLNIFFFKLVYRNFSNGHSDCLDSVRHRDNQILRVSVEIFFQASFRAFSKPGLVDGGLLICLVLSQRIAHRISIGLRSGLLTGLISFVQKCGNLSESKFWVARAVWPLAPSCWHVS